MIANNKHQIFADEYIISNGDAIASYQKAYPKAKSESARVKSYNLLQDVTIAEYIKEKQDKIRNERENTAIEALKSESRANILQREKALEMVSNVAKILYNKIGKNKYNPKTNEVIAFNSTIERLSKMDGWDKAIKTEITTPSDIIIKGQKFAKIKNEDKD